MGKMFFGFDMDRFLVFIWPSSCQFFLCNLGNVDVSLCDLEDTVIS